jgi:phosphoribosyl 1,2-cyclic phosphodiesterase
MQILMHRTTYRGNYQKTYKPYIVTVPDNSLKETEMKTYKINTSEILMPSYIAECLKKIEWMDHDEESISFYQDDFIMVIYGARGSTAFSGPHHIRYGSNTTSYQIWSPKLPTNMLYLGDGGSGILEIDKAVIDQCFKSGVNPFTANQKEVSKIISGVINTYTHYHYDHLHMGAPLSALFNANSIPKHIIGGDNPKKQFTKTFKRPAFPRDFGEVQASFIFHEITDPRSSVLIFTPNGEYRIMSTSDFNSFLQDGKPQIKHNRVFYNLDDCLVVRCYSADHPDPCISYRYENYNQDGELVMAVAFMTDHEIRETDDRNTYFMNHINNTDAVYFDGQYTNENFIPGFGHGRVEIIGKTAAKMNLKNILIGHHDPKRKDDEIDEMCFIPSKQRQRKGVVFGRMNFEKGTHEIEDDIGSQSSVVSLYKSFDLTQTYQVEDYTTDG